MKKLRMQGNDPDTIGDVYIAVALGYSAVLVIGLIGVVVLIVIA